MNPGCRFVATNTDSTFPIEGRFLPGNGAGVAAVATAVGRAPDIIIGKPHSTMAEVMKKANPSLDMPSTLMVFGVTYILQHTSFLFVCLFVCLTILNIQKLTV